LRFVSVNTVLCDGEYEKLDSEMEQREFYSVMDTLYELNNLWMLSGFIRQNQQVLLRETQEGTEYRKKPNFIEICRIGKDTMLSRMFQVMGRFHLAEYVAEDTDYTIITRRGKAYAATTGSGKTVPQIMLQGNRVRKWGFEAGSSMRVECFPNKLVILKE
jgi:hypothetical protein